MTSHHALALRARLGTSLARTLRYRGMLVLVIWQAPIQPVIQPDGSFAILVGAGTDEYAQIACDGSVTSEPIRYRVAAAEADFDLDSHVRIEAMGGVMTSDHASHDVGFGGARLRADWKHFGIGAGLVTGPELGGGGSTEVMPSGYVRAGSAEGLHGRWDVMPLIAAGTQQVGRIGLGYNAVERDRPAWFIGLAALGSSEVSTGVAGELTLPVSGRLALRAQGHYGPGLRHPVSGLMVGGRVMFGGGGGRTVSVDHRQDP